MAKKKKSAATPGKPALEAIREQIDAVEGLNRMLALTEVNAHAIEAHGLGLHLTHGAHD